MITEVTGELHQRPARPNRPVKYEEPQYCANCSTSNAKKEALRRTRIKQCGW
jgi:hypothetical protein